MTAGLRWLPGLLLAMVLVITILLLPMDLAHLEPFDAYSLRAAGAATLAIAVLGLAASLFVPMAYCRYGCPTGALLEFVRAHGPSDRFGRRDLAAQVVLRRVGPIAGLEIPGHPRLAARRDLTFSSRRILAVSGFC